jgi:hypothetical protein
MKKPFALTRDERNSALWNKLIDHWESRLEVLRIQNDGDKSDIDTANLRGRIAQVKADIALGNELPDLDYTPPR